MGAGVNDNIVDEIKSRCNIVDVISRHVVLKKTGNNYKGVCPFHNEKTPSFVVSDIKQIYTCFGCGATGDVISFVEKYHNIDFQEAVLKLADEYGIEVKKSNFSGEKEKTQLYEINREAAAFFYRAFTKLPNPGCEYMEKRGIDGSTLRKFGVGYADGQWDSLCKHFKANGIEPDVLIELGLISLSNGKYFDKYRDRVIFPIINTRGKVIGFGGRILGDGMPKYLNSQESQVFSKKNNLYGLNLTRQDINKEDYVILVEGYMDVISLYQNGVKNVAASLGTALTENQALMLKRYTENVIISYDSDDAGKQAAMRALDILHKAGCKAKVLCIDEGKDPDEFIKKNGKEAFLKLVNEAMTYADYKLYILKHRLNMDTTEGSVEYLQEAAKILKGLSPVEADIYIKKIANETKISEGAIRMEINGSSYEEHSENRQAAPKNYQTPKIAFKPEKVGKASVIEKYLIKLMLLKSTYVPRIKEYEWVFKSPSAYRIYELIQSVYKDDEEIDLKKIEDSLEEEESRLLTDILENIKLADKEEQVFEDCVARIKRSGIAKREQEIIQIMSILDDEEDREKIEALTMELIEIQKAKNEGK